MTTKPLNRFCQVASHLFPTAALRNHFRSFVYIRLHACGAHLLQQHRPHWLLPGGQ
jgi:hypothetical protein